MLGAGSSRLMVANSPIATATGTTSSASTHGGAGGWLGVVHYYSASIIW